MPDPDHDEAQSIVLGIVAGIVIGLIALLAGFSVANLAQPETVSSRNGAEAAPRVWVRVP